MPLALPKRQRWLSRQTLSFSLRMLHLSCQSKECPRWVENGHLRNRLR